MKEYTFTLDKKQTSLFYFMCGQLGINPDKAVNDLLAEWLVRADEHIKWQEMVREELSNE